MYGAQLANIYVNEKKNLNLLTRPLPTPLL